MAICPDCGNNVATDQEFCRECGTSVEEVADPHSDDDVHLHLKHKDKPLRVNRVRYHQGGGHWVTVTLKDNSIRIYPREDVEYIEGTGVGVMGQGIRPVADKREVKEVNSFSKAAQVLGSLTGN